jgi:hypothetical protein
VDGGWILNDGDQPVQVPLEWAIAPADDDVRFLCGQHAWRSSCLVLIDGSAIYTKAAKTISDVGFFATPGQWLCMWLWSRARTSLNDP